jgi:hypothetical protein
LSGKDSRSRDDTQWQKARYLRLVTDLGDVVDEESRLNAARAAGY